MTIARQAGSASSVSSAVASSSRSVEAQGVERIRSLEGHQRDRRAASRAGAADAGAGAGNSTRMKRGVVSPVAAAARVPVLAALGAALGGPGHGVLDECSDSIHGRGSGGVHLRRVLEHEERRQSRGDLAQVPAGGPHRVRGEPGVEGGPVVEAHRRHEDQVGLAAERLDDPADPRLAQARASPRRAAGAPRCSAARRWPGPPGRRRAGDRGRAAWSSGHLR